MIFYGSLPERHRYSCRRHPTMRLDWFFLPVDGDARRTAESIIDGAAQKMGMRLLGWRDVPVHPQTAGDLARRVMPVIRMVFVGKGGLADDASFQRGLLLMRKTVENQVRNTLSEHDHRFTLSV